MDIYLLAIVALITFSILVILYIRIFAKNISSSNRSNDLDNLKSDDFTLLE